MNIQQNRQRYAKLVDKKFAVGLTEKEEVEQRQLEDALDEADRVFYEPIKDALAKEIERLRQVHAPIQKEWLRSRKRSPRIEQ